MATIRDVAQRAQVSVATVSHVINDSRYVSPETKERVQSAIAELNYRRDGIARSLRRSETGTIGVIISDITNPFFADLVKGIEDVTHNLEQRLNLILCNTEEDVEKERLYLDVLLEKRVDGLILAPAGGNETYLASLAERSFPLVFVDRILTSVSADSLVVDNFAASKGLTRHLLERGHQRLAVLEAMLHASPIAERIDGCKQALAEAGLDLPDEFVFKSASDIDAAHAAGRRILDLNPLPDAVLCTNNFMTLGMMRALNERGLSCPDNIALAGFDDFPWADSFRPRITAVAQPAFEMGRKAVELLWDRMKKRRTSAAETFVLSTSLLIRESSG